MNTILKYKQSKSNFASQARSQYSIFNSRQVAHSFDVCTQMRKNNLSLDFGQTVSTVVHSRNYIADMWLMVELETSTDGDYAKDVGLQILERLSLHFKGGEVENLEYTPVMYELLHNLVDKPARDTLIKFHGGAKSTLPGDSGKVLIYLPFFFSSIHRQLKRGPCWHNGNSANKMQITFEVAPASKCSAGTASHKINNAQLWWEEYILPVSLQSSFVPANSKSKFRPVIQVLGPYACTQGQSQEINLSSALSAGNIKTLSFRFSATAAVGENADCYQDGAVSQPQSVILKVNGVEFEELENPLEVQLSEYLQGWRRAEGEDTLPYRYSFAQNPDFASQIAGHLPSSHDNLTCTIVPAQTGSLSIIVSHMKKFIVDGSGRVTKNDG